MRRDQQIECVIAHKIVSVGLRPGGGFREPEGAYVRCSERDCQYADLNRPPCPLRIEMFAGESDRDVALYLAARAGTRICFGCIATALEITHEQVRRATWRVKDTPGVSIRPGRCSGCRRRGVTVGVAPDAVPAISDLGAAQMSSVAPRPIGAPALAEHVRGRPRVPFCTHCLARNLRTTPADVRAAMWTLEREPAFAVRTGLCVQCQQRRRIIVYEEAAAVDARDHIIAFLLHAAGEPQCDGCIAFGTDLGIGEVRTALAAVEILPWIERRDGTCATCGRRQAIARVQALPGDEYLNGRRPLGGPLRHRGFRIELLSFKTHGGWRPFALVKTATGALVPEAPALLFVTNETREEADEVAASHARAWIDKRFA